MCEQCQAETIDIGEIGPGWLLCVATKDGDMMKKGDYGFIRCNNPDFIIPASLKPFPNPFQDYTDEQLDNLTDEENDKFCDFYELEEKLRPHLKCDFETAYELVVAGKEIGWDEKKDGCFAIWFIHQVGKAVADFDKKYPNGFPEELFSRYKSIEDGGEYKEEELVKLWEK